MKCEKIMAQFNLKYYILRGEVCNLALPVKIDTGSANKSYA